MRTIAVVSAVVAGFAARAVWAQLERKPAPEKPEGDSRLAELEKLFAVQAEQLDHLRLAQQERDRELKLQIDALKSITLRMAGPQPQREPVEEEAVRFARGEVHLTVVQEPRCGTCSYFDLEEGQAVLKTNPHFLAACEHLTPNQMGVRRAVDPETGDLLPLEQQPTPLFKAKEDKWELIGLCEKHSRPNQQELRHSADRCDAFAARRQGHPGVALGTV